jgi:hypothetical protein
MAAAAVRLTPRSVLPINRGLRAEKPHRQGAIFSAAGECPERQRGRTVNPLAYAFVGSSPTSPTILKSLGNLRSWPLRKRPFSYVACCMIFPNVFNGCHRFSAATRDTHATHEPADW